MIIWTLGGSRPAGTGQSRSTLRVILANVLWVPFGAVSVLIAIAVFFTG